MNNFVNRSGQMKSIQGTAKPTFADGSARFGVTFDSLPCKYKVEIHKLIRKH